MCSRGDRGGVKSLHGVAGLQSHWDQRCEIADTTGALPWLGVGSVRVTGWDG